MSQPSWIGLTLSERYRIEELLGEGGMSAVYKGTDPNLRRTVAIKLIHTHLSKDAEFVSRFEEEAAAVAQLRHRNAIQVFDFDHDGDTYYMVLEFVPGETLQARLTQLNASNRRLSTEETIALATSICDALSYAHKRGLIHRDVKPANIMLDVHGQPILMDFGIAKIIGGKLHTATGAILGTALYMSPEQIRGELPDSRVDIYSLGVVLFEMASGRPPFEGDSAMTVMMKHVNDPVPDLRELNPDAPPALKAVIEKALAKDPKDRFQTTEEMSRALRDVLIRPEIAAKPSHAATVLEEPLHVGLPPVKETVLEPRLPSLGEPPPATPASPAPTSLARRTGRAGSGDPAGSAPPARPRSSSSRKLALGAGIGAFLLVGLAGLVCVGLLVRGAGPAALSPSPSPSELPTAVTPQDPTQAALPTLVPPVGSSKIYIEYILDASGSMLELLGPATRLAAAQEVLSTRVATLPPGVHVGLRVYGHRVPFQQEQESCQDIELVVPLQQGGSERIIEWLRGMQALGMTPMAESIRLASEDFTFEPGRRNVIVLISDGIETCGDDPADVVQRLQELGIDFKIHVIGLDVDPAARAQLQRIAAVADGTYFDAQSEQDLDAALGAVQDILVQPLPEAQAPTETPFPEANVDSTAEGAVQASTTYEGFPASLGVDGDPTTSWFSTGPEAGGVPTTYVWTGAQDDFIASISILSNDLNAEPANRTGYGFESLTVQVLDAAGTVVFEEEVALPGTPDPRVTLHPNVVGRSIVLLYSGHESLDCGGFAELQVGVFREGE